MTLLDLQKCVIRRRDEETPPTLSHLLLCSQLVLPGADRTGHSGALEAAVAARDLLQVLLVLVLSIVELLPLQDLRGNGAEAFFIQLLGGIKKGGKGQKVITHQQLSV